MAKITKDANFRDILDQYGMDAARILMENGMHCVGCAASHFESLEEGCRAHGFDDKKIEEILKKLNDLAEKSGKEKKQKEKQDKNKTD